MQTKSAEAMKNNEKDAPKKLEELHADPPGRASGTLDAPWGENPPADPAHNGKAAWDEFLKDQPQLLDKAFDGFESSAKGDKALVSALFNTNDYSSRSPLLRKYAEAGHIESDASLGDRVQKLTGRR